MLGRGLVVKMLGEASLVGMKVWWGELGALYWMREIPRICKPRVV
jgi:hypothetical protein